MAFEKELETALAAARQAGKYLEEAYRTFEVIPDAPADISTEADRQSQEIILSYLKKVFPSDGFCAEESTPCLAGSEQKGDRLWIIDPIDGTRGFARKNGEFSVMIAFVQDGEIGVGVVFEPVKKRLTYAVQGSGCWKWDEPGTSPVRCQVSAVDKLTEARLTQSRSRSANPSGPVSRIGPAQVLETYSAGIKLALVARGEADLYVNTYQEFHDWDICAGEILVKEAGGRVSGLSGETLQYGLPGAWQRAGLLATNGSLHESALEKLAGILNTR